MNEPDRNDRLQERRGAAFWLNSSAALAKTVASVPKTIRLKGMGNDGGFFGRTTGVAAQNMLPLKRRKAERPIPTMDRLDA